MKLHLSILLLLPFSLPHAQQQGTTSIPTNTYSLDLSGLPGDVTSTDWGDFDGDGQEDLLLLAGETVSIFFAPGIYEALVEDVSLAVTNNNPVRDFAVLRRGTEASQPTGRDRIFVIDDDGLVELVFGLPSAPFSVTRVVYGGFGDAQLLDAWSSADASDHWIAGSDSTGATIYLGEFSGSQPLATSIYTTVSPFAATDLVLFDWDGDAEPELGFSTGNSLAIFDPWGTDTPVVAVDPAVSYLDIARMRRGEAGDGPEGLATLGVSTPGTFLATWQGSVDNFQILPSAHDFYSVTAGRWGTDTRDDLVLAGNGTESVFIVTDEGLGSTADLDFGTTHIEAPYDSVSGVAPGDAAAQVSEARLLDLDHDGDMDLHYALKNAGRMWVHRNAEYDELLDSAQLDFEGYSVGNDPFGGVYDRATGFLDLKLTLPATLPGPYLDVVAWGQEGDSETIDPDNIVNQRIVITPADETAGYIEVTLDLTSVSIVTTTKGVDYYGWTKGVYALLQFVESTSSQPSVVASHGYPATGLQLFPLNHDWDYQTSFGFFVHTVNMPPIDGGGGGTSTSGSGGSANCIPGPPAPRRP